MNNFMKISLKSIFINQRQIVFVMKVWFCFFLSSYFAEAFVQKSTPQGISIQGNILTPQGLPVEASIVNFTVEVRSPSPVSCLLYSENHVLSMIGSGGNFSLILGQGVRSGTNFENTSTLSQAFENLGTTLNSLSCSIGNSYTPGASDQRNINLSFNDGAGLHTLAQLLNVQSVPYAFNADSLQGLSPDKFLNLGTNSVLTQPNVENIFSPLNYSKLTSLLSYQTSQYVMVGTNGSVALPASASAPLNPSAGQIWYDSFYNVMKYFDGNTTQTLGTSNPPSVVSGNAITNGIIGGSTAINTTGNIQTSGSVGTSKLMLFDHLGLGPGYIGMQAPSNIGATSSYNLIFPNTIGSSGQVLVNDGTGVLSWVNQTAGALTALSGTTPINITGSSQVPIIGVDSATVTSKGVVTLADIGGVTLGTVVQASDPRMSNSRSPSGIASGDLIGSYPSPLVAKIQGTPVSASTPNISGQVMRFDGSNWSPNFVSMFDLRSTITGVQAFDSIGCTSAQTLTWTSATDNLSCSNILIGDSQINYASQFAKLFLASPTASAGVPLFRTMASSDLPAGGYDATYFKNGGSSFGANSTLGSSDNFSLSFITNSISRLSILSSGNIGIGTASPTAPLQVSMTNTSTSGNIYGLVVSPTYNQVSGSAANTDLMINRTQTAVGSGTQRLIDAQVGGVSKFSVDTSGNITSAGTTSTSGNIAQTGTTTFSTGTGAVSINGSTTFAAGSGITMTSGTGKFTQTYSGAGPASAITGTATASGDLLDLITTSTAAVNNDKALNIGISGANATSSVTRYGVYSNLTSTGTTSTNIAGYFSASGATNNYGLLIPNGLVGIGTTAPTNSLSLGGQTAQTIWMERNTTAATAGNNLTLQASGAVAGGTNLNGGSLNLSSGTSTGTGSSIISFLTSLSGTSGSTDNVPTTKMTILGSGNVGIATTTPAEKLDVAGNIKLQHLIGKTSAPTFASGTGAGTSPTISVTGTDLALKLNVTTGTAPTGSNAVIATVTFSTAYASAPICLFSPGNAAAALLSGVTNPFITSTATTVVLNSGSSALSASSAYIWNISCTQ